MSKSTKDEMVMMLKRQTKQQDEQIKNFKKQVEELKKNEASNEN